MSRTAPQCPPLRRASSALAQFLFGSRCLACEQPAPETGFCPACETQLLPLHAPICLSTHGHSPLRVAAAFEYGGAIARAIQRFKFSGHAPLARPLAQLLAPSITAHFPMLHDTVWLPVPLGNQRLRERGFNQSALLARHLSRLLGGRVSYDHLLRVRNTPEQHLLPPALRRTNLQSAFVFHRPPFPMGQGVLVDDVCTTGSTLRACSEALRHTMPHLEVRAVTLACVA